MIESNTNQSLVIVKINLKTPAKIEKFRNWLVLGMSRLPSKCRRRYIQDYTRVHYYTGM